MVKGIWVLACVGIACSDLVESGSVVVKFKDIKKDAAFIVICKSSSSSVAVWTLRMCLTVVVVLDYVNELVDNDCVDKS